MGAESAACLLQEPHSLCLTSRLAPAGRLPPLGWLTPPRTACQGPGLLRLRFPRSEGERATTAKVPTLRCPCALQLQSKTGPRPHRAEPLQQESWRQSRMCSNYIPPWYLLCAGCYAGFSLISDMLASNNSTFNLTITPLISISSVSPRHAQRLAR